MILEIQKYNKQTQHLMMPVGTKIICNHGGHVHYDGWVEDQKGSPIYLLNMVAGSFIALGFVACYMFSNIPKLQVEGKSIQMQFATAKHHPECQCCSVKKYLPSQLTAHVRLRNSSDRSYHWSFLCHLAPGKVAKIQSTPYTPSNLFQQKITIYQSHMVKIVVCMFSTESNSNDWILSSR